MPPKLGSLPLKN